MSTVAAITYDFPVVPTLSDSDDEPTTFTGVYASTAGDVVLWPYGGPHAGLPLTFGVAVGTYLRFPVRRIGATGTTATVFGLVSAIVR